MTIDHQAMNATNLTDEQLLSGLYDRDKNAIKYLYTAFWPMILNFVLLNSGTEADAKDLFQEGILDFLEKLWKGNLVLTCKLKTYLYSVCKYKWLNKLKRRWPVIDIETYEDRGEVMPVFDNTGTTLPNGQELASAVHSLGEPCKSLLIGFYYEGLSMEQIAVKLDYKSAQVVKQQKFRCKERLKQTLTKFMKIDLS